jgi:hypothetical protein
VHCGVGKCAQRRPRLQQSVTSPAKAVDSLEVTSYSRPTAGEVGA